MLKSKTEGEIFSEMTLHLFVWWPFKICPPDLHSRREGTKLTWIYASDPISFRTYLSNNLSYIYCVTRSFRFQSLFVNTEQGTAFPNDPEDGPKKISYWWSRFWHFWIPQNLKCVCWFYSDEWQCIQYIPMQTCSFVKWY